MAYLLQQDEAIELKLKCVDLALRIDASDASNTVKSAKAIFDFVTQKPEAVGSDASTS